MGRQVRVALCCGALAWDMNPFLSKKRVRDRSVHRYWGVFLFFIHSLRTTHFFGLFAPSGYIRDQGCGSVQSAARPEIDAMIAFAV